MMVPTIGRVVYYHQGVLGNSKVLASVIAYVWSDTLVNLMIIDTNGIPSGKTSVYQGPGDGQWDWMPYQKEKAMAGDHNSESAEPRPE